ncbi:MAG: hypothetical protein JWN93_3512 [Hyphomicrobiales bacterium]|nr:hypothetical protein [Hyphomicrobiales bacterium]
MPLIVIVDDRVTNRNIFAKLAASIEPEVTVQTFGDPQEALAWLGTASPDLLITDYKMPHYDGAEFIRRFRQIPGADDIPVIVITVYEERTFRLRALEAGATDFLHSPVDHHEFVTRARNLLKLRKHQMQLADRATGLARDLECGARALRRSPERLAQTLDALPVMVSVTDQEGCVGFVNARWAAFAGVDPEDAVGRPALLLYGEEGAARSLAMDRHLFDGGAPLPAYDEELTGAAGKARVFETTKTPLLDAQNRLAGVLTTAVDVTERKRQAAHLRHLAQHDPLTDLPNRTLLDERMRALIDRARRGGQGFALHVLDLDRFKRVNDRLGHAAGDRHIAAMARRLSGVVRRDDTLARLGGDEFAVLQTNVLDGADAAVFAERILAAVAQAAPGEAPMPSSGSLGVALHPADGQDSDELLAHADMAMYRAKAQGGGRFCFFDSGLKARALGTARLDAALGHALDRGELELVFQPQAELADGRVSGAAALLRWNRPGEGLCSPAVFLPRAQALGLGGAIGEWLLLAACRAARRWAARSRGRLTVSVDVSTLHLRPGEAPPLVARALAETGLEPDLLILEFGDASDLQDQEAALALGTALRDLGVGVCIDGVGANPCAPSDPRRLPVRRLSLRAGDAREASALRACVALGRNLGVEILADGVASPQEAARLLQEGCTLAQGDLFGGPMPEAQFLRALDPPVEGPALIARSA